MIDINLLRLLSISTARKKIRTIILLIERCPLMTGLRKFFYLTIFNTTTWLVGDSTLLYNKYRDYNRLAL